MGAQALALGCMPSISNRLGRPAAAAAAEGGRARQVLAARVAALVAGGSRGGGWGRGDGCPRVDKLLSADIRFGVGRCSAATRVGGRGAHSTGSSASFLTEAFDLWRSGQGKGALVKKKLRNDIRLHGPNKNALLAQGERPPGGLFCLLRALGHGRRGCSKLCGRCSSGRCRRRSGGIRSCGEGTKGSGRCGRRCRGSCRCRREGQHALGWRGTAKI